MQKKCAKEIEGMNGQKLKKIIRLMKINLEKEMVSYKKQIKIIKDMESRIYNLNLLENAIKKLCLLQRKYGPDVQDPIRKEIEKLEKICKKQNKEIWHDDI